MGPSEYDNWWREVPLRKFAALRTEEWPADSGMAFAANGAMTAPAGSALRDVGCLICLKPMMSSPFQVWALVGSSPCGRGGNHLISVSGLLHVTCMGPDAAFIADRIRFQSAGCFEQ